MMELFDTSLPDRFWDKVMPVPESGCWVWVGAVSDTGYGRFGPYKSHALTAGPVPKGYDRDHRCRVRSCCNPAHLEIVTHAENVRRGLVSALRPPLTVCRNGHEYTDENTYVNPRGYKQCRTCMRLNMQRNTRAFRERKKQRESFLRSQR